MGNILLASLKLEQISDMAKKTTAKKVTAKKPEAAPKKKKAAVTKTAAKPKAVPAGAKSSPKPTAKPAAKPAPKAVANPAPVVAAARVSTAHEEAERSRAPEVYADVPEVPVAPVASKASSAATALHKTPISPLSLSISAQSSAGAAANGNTHPANILVIVTCGGSPVTDLSRDHFTLMEHFDVPGQLAPFSNNITSFRNAGTGAYLLQTKPITGAPWRSGHHLAQILVSSPDDYQGQVAVKIVIR